jgi:hypothetical protein
MKRDARRVGSSSGGEKAPKQWGASQGICGVVTAGIHFVKQKCFAFLRDSLAAVPLFRSAARSKKGRASVRQWGVCATAAFEENEMIQRFFVPGVALGAFAVFAIAGASPSFALTAKECSAKYQAAKTAGTLNGLTWNDYRKKECAGAEPAADSKAATTDTKPVVKPSTSTTAAPATAPAGAVFPKAIDPKYAKETAGKQRMHTCLDQYHANKASNGNGGLKWIQKGGGYYSLCNAALKS